MGHGEMRAFPMFEAYLYDEGMDKDALWGNEERLTRNGGRDGWRDGVMGPSEVVWASR